MYPEQTKSKEPIAFLTSDPIAAQVFYSNIASHLSVSSIAKLAAMLLKCLCASVDSEKAKMAELQANDGKKRRRYGKRQIDEEEEEDESGETSPYGCQYSPNGSVGQNDLLFVGVGKSIDRRIDCLQ